MLLHATWKKLNWEASNIVFLQANSYNVCFFYIANLWHWSIAFLQVAVLRHSLWSLLWLKRQNVITSLLHWYLEMINKMILRENGNTWLEDHWAAAMAVLATEKALTRFPSGSKRSLKKQTRIFPHLAGVVLCLPYLYCGQKQIHKICLRN